MARAEARIAGLLAAILLVHTLLLQPPRLVTDRLPSTLDLRFDGRRLVDLVNRRNMILLCHAILLVILVDAGLLAAPAQRRRRTSATATASASAAACGAVDRSLVSPNADDASGTKSVAVAAAATCVKRERRRAREPAKATARVPRRRLPLARAAPREDAAETQEIDLVVVDNQCTQCRSKLDHAAVQEIPMAEENMNKFHFQVIADEERSRGVEGTEAECADDDVDEMNRRCEEFIASMRRRMQLESLQLVKV